MNGPDPRIDLRLGEVPGARFLSGSIVYDEAFADGRHEDKMNRLRYQRRDR
jgi:hypothetical protein